MTFKDFKFKSRLAYAISRAGFVEPSPIQQKAIPLVLEGKDVVGQAHTGTGKTAAFALPVLQNISAKDKGACVVIVPTRELATQVADEFYKFSRNLNIRTATVYGGTSYKRQIEHIGNAGIIVATPGRLLDLLEKNKIDLNPKYLVLDEADEMLNMGFLEDVRRIFSFFRDRKQTLLFSATMPEEIKDLAYTVQKNPEFIRVEKEAVTNNNIKQYYYVVDEHERDDAILRLIETANPEKAIIFCRTKRETARLADYLEGQGFRVGSLHGDKDQWERQKTMKAFRRNEYELLVATDVAARGLDVRGVTHVFNYHIPFEAESYVHRIGRTGRAKRDGVAMMLVTPHELRELKRIQKDVGSELEVGIIPQKNMLTKDLQSSIEAGIKEQNISIQAKNIFDVLIKKYSEKDLALGVFSLLEKNLQLDSQIGKSQNEIDSLLGKISDDDLESESKKSSRLYKEREEKKKKRGPRKKTTARVKKNSSFDKIERGTERGQVPIPTITKTGGGSRIVARKLY